MRVLTVNRRSARLVDSVYFCLAALLPMTGACAKEPVSFERPAQIEPTWEFPLALRANFVENNDGGYVLAGVGGPGSQGAHVSARDARGRQVWFQIYAGEINVPSGLVRLTDGNFAISSSTPSRVSVTSFDPTGAVRWEIWTHSLSSPGALLPRTGGGLSVIGTHMDPERRLDQRYGIWTVGPDGKEASYMDLWLARFSAGTGRPGAAAEHPEGGLVVAALGLPKDITDERIEVARFDAAGGEMWHTTVAVLDQASERGLFIDGKGVIRIVGHARFYLDLNEVDDGDQSPLERPFMVVLDAHGKLVSTVVHDEWKADIITIDQAIAAPDGDIVVCGNALNFDRPRRSFVARFAPDGSFRWARAVPPRGPPGSASAAAGIRFAGPDMLVVADPLAPSLFAIPADGGIGVPTRY